MTTPRPPRRRSGLPPRKQVDAAYRQIVGTDDLDLRPLAAQLVQAIWRNNNETVERLLHAGDGPLTDEDMMRHNAWLTSVMADTLARLPANVDLEPDDGDWLHDELRSVFEPEGDIADKLDAIAFDDDMRAVLREMLEPLDLGDLAADVETARDSLRLEVSRNASAGWMTDGIIDAARKRDWVYALKLATWRSHFTFAALDADQWWGMPQWNARVDMLLANFPDGPDPATLRSRLIEAPWELSDEQATWLVDHRYDGPHASPDVPKGAF
jgi:hypothetical protein